MSNDYHPYYKGTESVEIDIDTIYHHGLSLVIMQAFELVYRRASASPHDLETSHRQLVAQDVPAMLCN